MRGSRAGSQALGAGTELLNGDGLLFGGYIAALADQLLGFAAMTVVPEGSAFRTINLNVQFLRVGRAHPLLAEARVTAQTTSLITVEASFFREDDKDWSPGRPRSRW